MYDYLAEQIAKMKGKLVNILYGEYDDMSLTKAFKQHHPTSRLYAYHHKPSMIDELKRQGVEIISDETIHRPGTIEQYMECTLENTLRKYRNVKFDLVFMNYPYVHFFGDVVSKQYAKFYAKMQSCRCMSNGFQKWIFK